ncbi:uncharacterized protein [Salvelinus sp. IW2-2015]|uniref:uncharacterized protein n=1 Tax=Salvelinus sp. IW2-2015 TaxID=2691554 RepID=UPI0038D451B7
MVSQAPAGHSPLPSAPEGGPVVERKDPRSDSQQSAVVVPSTVLKTMTPPKTEPFSPRPVAPPTAVPQTPEQKTLIRPVHVMPPVQPPDEKPVLPKPVVQPPVQENHLLQQPQVAQARFSVQTPVSFYFRSNRHLTPQRALLTVVISIWMGLTSTVHSHSS